MEERLVSFETAKLAAEKEFNIPCFKGFDEKGNILMHHEYLSYCQGEPMILYDDFLIKKDYISHTEDGKRICKYLCPTQSLLQKWLRDVHNIDIQIIINKPGYNEYKVQVYKTDLNLNTFFYKSIVDEIGLICWFYDYEEALEEALKIALDLI